MKMAIMRQIDQSIKVSYFHILDADMLDEDMVKILFNGQRVGLNKKEVPGLDNILNDPQAYFIGEEISSKGEVAYSFYEIAKGKVE